MGRFFEEVDRGWDREYAEATYKLDDLCVVASPQVCSPNGLAEYALIATSAIDIRAIQTAVLEWWERLRDNHYYIQRAFEQGYARKDFANELLSHMMAHLVRDLRKSLMLAERVPSRMARVYQTNHFDYYLRDLENNYTGESHWQQWITEELKLLGIIRSRPGTNVRTGEFYLDNFFYVNVAELDTWVAAKLLFLESDHG